MGSVGEQYRWNIGHSAHQPLRACMTLFSHSSRERTRPEWAESRLNGISRPPRIGFVKSSTQRDRPIYFTYCGRAIIANRWYLDASTGRISSKATS